MNADVSAQIIKQSGTEGEHNGVVMAVQDKPLGHRPCTVNIKDRKFPRSRCYSNKHSEQGKAPEGPFWFYSFRATGFTVSVA